MVGRDHQRADTVNNDGFMIVWLAGGKQLRYSSAWFSAGHCRKCSCSPRTISFAEQYIAGKSQVQIAKENNLSPSRVQRIVKKAEACCKRSFDRNWNKQDDMMVASYIHHVVGLDIVARETRLYD